LAPWSPPVGAQCSNYYRQLIERGVIKDPNYYIDEKGKAHYLFSTKKDKDGNPIVKTMNKKKRGSGSDGEGSDGDGSDTGKATTKRRRTSGGGGGGGGKRGRGRRSRDDDDEADEWDEWDLDNLDPERIQAEQARYKSSQWRTTKRTRALMGEAADDEEEQQLRAQNPLPGLIDPITLEEVVKPAISPYGHVMRYASQQRR